MNNGQVVYANGLDLNSFYCVFYFSNISLSLVLINILTTRMGKETSLNKPKSLPKTQRKVKHSKEQSSITSSNELSIKSSKANNSFIIITKEDAIRNVKEEFQNLTFKDFKNVQNT